LMRLESIVYTLLKVCLCVHAHVYVCADC